MTKVPFSEMNLNPKLERAVNLMGFDYATPVQSEAIPAIRTGADVIARSQTGTGKTAAFAIPAIELVDTDETKTTAQVLVLCPTRELAIQALEEFRKLARFKENIRPVAVYGGAPIEKQCIDLRHANIVIGTPGRVMDHMRRKTLKLQALKLIVLDEADEMLDMGFKEDIETILSDTPETRQTVLFSATMPPEILRITKQFQKDPVLIEIDKNRVTIEDIEQRFIDVPHARKKEALILLLRYYDPKRAIIFCGTKRMADELTVFLCENGIGAEGIHSDISQARRMSTMQGFKAGKTTLLIATDIAARGIDVSDVEYVINFDLPQNTEAYIHRIGRTGRAGKAGCSITICSSRQDVSELRKIALAVKSEILELALPTGADVGQKAVDAIEKARSGEMNPVFTEAVRALIEKGQSPEAIAAAALEICFGDTLRLTSAAASQFKHDAKPAAAAETRKSASYEGEKEKKRAPEPAKIKPLSFGLIVIDIGANARVTPNHIVGAIADRTGISGKEIGKVEISAEQSFVEIPKVYLERVLEQMRGCKICGKMTQTSLLAGPVRVSPARPSAGGPKPRNSTGRPHNGDKYHPKDSAQKNRRG